MVSWEDVMTSRATSAEKTFSQAVLEMIAYSLTE